MRHTYEYSDNWLRVIYGGGTAFAKNIPINAIIEDVETLETISDEKDFQKYCQDNGWLHYDYYSGEIYSRDYKIPIQFRTQLNSELTVDTSK